MKVHENEVFKIILLIFFSCNLFKVYILYLLKKLCFITYKLFCFQLVGSEILLGIMRGNKQVFSLHKNPFWEKELPCAGRQQETITCNVL